MKKCYHPVVRLLVQSPLLGERDTESKMFEDQCDVSTVGEEIR